MRRNKYIFRYVQLICDWLNCFVAKGISCLISSFRVGYVNTRAIDRKFKSKAKRKRAVLSIKDKQIVISRLDKGEKGTNLAQKFGISEQQISGIRKNKDKTLKFFDSIETSEGLKRKSPKLTDDEQLNKALYAWFIQQRSTGTSISDPLPQEKATQLNTKTVDREFKASSGWLEKFKTREPRHLRRETFSSRINC